MGTAYELEIERTGRLERPVDLTAAFAAGFTEALAVVERVAFAERTLDFERELAEARLAVVERPVPATRRVLDAVERRALEAAVVRRALAFAAVRRVVEAAVRRDAGLAVVRRVVAAVERPAFEAAVVRRALLAAVRDFAATLVRDFAATRLFAAVRVLAVKPLLVVRFAAVLRAEVVRVLPAAVLRAVDALRVFVAAELVVEADLRAFAATGRFAAFVDVRGFEATVLRALVALRFEAWDRTAIEWPPFNGESFIV